LFIGTGEAFCRNLALVARSSVYLRGQFVQRSGEIGHFMCYLHHGVVEVHVSYNNKS